MASPQINLVRRENLADDFACSAQQLEVLNHKGSPLLVLGGPGTGKTKTLTQLVVNKINAGANPNSILVIAFGRERAGELRDEIVLQSGASAFEPMVRTFHSLAFSVINESVHDQDPKYVLISGAEQDAFIRTLLANIENSPKVNWPQILGPALGTRGFARELRDLILRASERNMGYQDLLDKAKELNEPWWVPATAFWKEYDQTLGLQYGTVSQTARRIDSSSIISAAINRLRKDSTLATRIRAKFPTILVDEFQESDQSQRDLLAELSGNDLTLFADPDSAIGRFRGADPEGVLAYKDKSGFKVLELNQVFRTSPSITKLTDEISSKFRSNSPTRKRVAAEFKGTDLGVNIAKLGSNGDCANYIAHAFRTAHLRDGVPWSQMAVILRSPGAAITALQRAFSLNNIPIDIDAGALALGDNPAIRPILSVAQIALGKIKLTPSNFELVEELLRCEFGGADSLSIRQMRVDLAKTRQDGDSKTSTQMILDVLDDNQAPIEWDSIRPLQRVAELIAAARKSLQAKVDVTDLIWAIWSNAKNYEGELISSAWRTRALKGGSRAAAADRDLDAVIQLFESARRFSQRLPDAKPELFIDQILGESILSDAITARGQREEVVSVMTVHSAKGMEWELVALTGLQEGVWPNLRQRGSLLGSERLVESWRTGLVSRQEIEASAASALVEDERRLLHVGVSRAKSGLIVTAYSEEDSEPSPYFEEIYTSVTGVTSHEAPIAELPRALTPQALVSTLRRQLLDDSGDKDFAASLLRTLAESGIDSAHPDNWLGANAISSTDPALSKDAQVSVSPSNLQSFSECGFKWFIERSGGKDGDSTAQLVGTAIHGLAAMLKDEPTLSVNVMMDRLTENWALIDSNEGWVKEYELRQALTKLRKFYDWHADKGKTLHGVEAKFEKLLGRALLNGSVDRVEIDESGKIYIVDLKTGAPNVTNKKIDENQQLAGYQLAVLENAFLTPLPSTQTSGAVLVFLGDKKAESANERAQKPIDHEKIKELVIDSAEKMSGDEFSATINSRCRTCAVKSSCPAQPQGRSVIDL
jgi:superfamily I DNA/RNA helicase